MGDKLILNFSAKFRIQRKFIISHVKLQNCHDNISCMSISAKLASRSRKTIETVTIKGGSEWGLHISVVG